MYCIFDLDGTVIDSSHRQATLPNGDLDLAHWIENSKPEKVMRDSLLPVFAIMRKRIHDENSIVIICTARVLGDADYDFFFQHGILANHILSRPDGCTMADAELKDIQLRLLAQSLDLAWSDFCDNAVMFDDNQNVIKRLSGIGLLVSDANRINKRMVS